MDSILLLMGNALFVNINFLLGVILTIILIAYAFSKEGKDERGRGIIGTASILGIVLFFILVNVIGYFIYLLAANVTLLMSSLQLLYTTVILCIDIAVVILRRIR